MRLGGRLQAAIDIFDEIETRKRSVSEVLRDWHCSHRFAGSGDRAAIGNIVYDALRNRASISWKMESEAAIDIVYGALLNEGSFDLERIERGIAGNIVSPPFLSKDRLFLWANRNLLEAPLHVQADIPQGCLESLMFLSKVNEGIALAQRPPIDLRVNNLLSTTSKVARQLSFCGAMPVSWCRHALRVAPARGLNRRPNLQRSEAFKSGLFEVQDIGSQVVSYLCQVKPGMEILDYCAGSGGKALAFSAEMRNVGKIHAFDARKSRIVPIFARLSRANVRNVQVHVERDTLDSLLGCIDVVVIDAPCTGSGTWRRNPDMKWRLTDMQLSRRIEEQYDILEKASVFVRPGGHLVYITCSLFFEENDWQVERFLTHHSSFQLKNMRKHWNRLMPEQAPIPYVSKNGLLLSPFATGTDGFFISVIEKTI